MSFRIERRVQFHEIDAAGVMFFARFYEIAHQCFEHALLEVGFDLATALNAGHGLPLVHTESDFRHPLRFGDQIAVDVACAKIGGKSITMRYHFSLVATATDVATITLIHACVDMKGMTTEPVPCGLIAALERLT
jgi:YbgC/YbaW family acyl-CoA thioester hydrolase